MSTTTFTSSQIAKLLGCSNRTVREFLKRGILRGERQPNCRWRVSRAALVAVIFAACRDAGIEPRVLVRGPNGESPLLTTEKVAYGRAWFFWREDIEPAIAAGGRWTDRAKLGFATCH